MLKFLLVVIVLNNHGDAMLFIDLSHSLKPVLLPLPVKKSSTLWSALLGFICKGTSKLLCPSRIRSLMVNSIRTLQFWCFQQLLYRYKKNSYCIWPLI